jgi:catechol 2,3-dioxygenase-like lactoylglutathione lyase family enzyme
MAIDAQPRTRFDVGGILLDQPFKIRRLGHFGFNAMDLDACRDFYVDLLGFRISDEMDWSKRFPDPSKLEGLGSPFGYFTRYGGDHHAFVLFPRRVMDAMRGDVAFTNPDVTVNQITWQVGSLREVGDSVAFFQDRGVPLRRVGRDMPGSNWHAYISDPDGHTNELYYGIEQVGWTGHSKPRSMYHRGFREQPELPQMSELDEVQQALADGIDLQSGYRFQESLPATYDVDGILLPRPFKIVRIGPVRLFVRDLEASLTFYRDTLGFVHTQDVPLNGHRCVFLRTNTEHHSVALYPVELREQLGFSSHSSCLSFGVQVANYRQLREAVSFLQERGVRVMQVPPELSTGIDYSAFVLDPDGQAIELYYGMEQIGWDGRPRGEIVQRSSDPAQWPTTLEPVSDTYMGEPYLGPWG